ncbi:uncharacterized protein M421DRAFT_61217 [Didymella exigua CBS 183.55]|uniref:C2H2-type domain-containing protein n=1 Tax=Didymella exigua CBS 183.55 TaxID=1150837 RepID=A0A6A5RNE4_9PLEO|nr:uncharacterized protein M421DRAFT_61217 [Didymella exigua CBS 183.55]KAF1929169.1 hypothetical protein M421DRAFT_61217 [Didymella exigua CBS 183.55]
MGRAVTRKKHTCGRCEQLFNSRKELSMHMMNHEDAEPVQHQCPMCPFHFDDSLKLEQHRIVSGHLDVGQFKCDRCPQVFDTQGGYTRHRAHGKPCCDAKHFKDWKKTPRPGYIDPDKPKLVVKEAQELEYGGNSSGTPSQVSEGQEYCRCCKKTFASEFAYDYHVLVPRQPPIVLSDLPAPTSASSLEPQALAPAPERAPTTPSAGAKKLVCNINGCTRSYASEAGLNMHKTDVHGFGGQGLDLHGRDSWMLAQRERERLRAEGQLKAPTGSRGGRNGNSGGRGGNSGGHRAPAPASFHIPPSHTLAQRVAPSHESYQQVTHHAGVSTTPPLPTSHNISDALEMEQAKFLCSKTLRLLLQTDVFIHHDGKMSVGGIDWTRISVDRQPDVTGMFNDMCHLPRILQSLEYVPAPKTFATEYTAQYPVAEFESAPTRNPAKPALDIIAMYCSKIVLANVCQEVVKIAAVDVLTCRVLMSHLVCNNPHARVVNWHPATTGLSSFQDMEDARQAGYRVLKGWTAARSALFKFVDKETIIVGHNLRAELDALRIIHGRAIDIAKVVESAAKGPLSKAQVSLDSWCRDVANVARLETDPVFGRDCLVNAFAVREIGLWTIKNKEKLEQVAKQKTKEYQLVMKN